MWAALPACLMMLGCGNISPLEVAPQGANPPATTAIGPVPGPAVAPQHQAGNPYADDRIAYTEGRRLFLWYNCYGCHGGRAGGGMGPNLRGPDFIFGNSDSQFFSSIAEGRAEGMPSWRTKISEDQIWKIVAYLKTLNTPNEPDPPQ